MRFVCLLLLLLSNVPALAQQPAKHKARYAYQLYIPDSYSATKTTYPLLIYLHGGSQRGKDLSRLNTYGPTQEIAKGRKFPFIIAAPQCPEGKYWSTENWLDSLYDELTTTYRIDRKRVYLTGISMGGYGTWQTAVAYPDRFAAIAPLCGGCDDSTRICQIRNVPIWTFHGTADDVIPIDETERLVRRLRTCKGNVRYDQLIGRGHDIQDIYAGKAIYEWLLRRRQK